MMLAALLIATTLLAAFTVLPLSRHEAWWIRDLDFPRLQLFVLACVLLALTAMTRDLSQTSTWGIIVVNLLCLSYQAWWITPYTRIFPTEVKITTDRDPQRAIRIITANVLTTNHNAQSLLDLVRKHEPDILVTLESDAWWQTQLDALETNYPHTLKCPLDNLYGMHIYSKLPLEDSRIEYLVQSDVPSMHAHVRLRSGHGVRMHFLHPAPPSPSENEQSAERDAELIVVARSVAETADPVIITGDLNDVAWSSTTRLFRKISGLLDPRVGRGMFNTFHANHWFMRWPLDHLFHSGHFSLVEIQRLPSIGSDHFPLLTELQYTPGSGGQRSEPHAEAEDRSRAEAITAAQGVGKRDVPKPHST